MTIQLGHESLAETHDFCIATAARIEVRTALSTADGQTSHSILEDLLEAQELDDAQVNRGVKTQAALEGSQSCVVLYTVATVGVPNMVIIFPSYTELDSTLGLNHALQQASLLVLGMSVDNRLQRGQNLFNSLQELGLVRVLCFSLSDYAFNVSIHCFFLQILLFVSFRNPLTTKAAA